jgi:hypothetical protein
MATPTPHSGTTRRKRPTADQLPSAADAQHGPSDSRQHRDLRDAIRDGAKSQLAKQKVRATESLSSISTAARATTRHLRDEGQEGVARVVEQAVDRVDTWARSLEQTEIEDIVSGVNTFARRQPTLFLATAFGLGIVAARFFKSSASSGVRRSSDGIRT